MDRRVASLSWALAIATLLVLAPGLGRSAEAQLIKAGPHGFQPSDLAPWEGRVVQRIGLEGHKTTREHVIAREIRTELGQPLDLAVITEDFTRLDNLAIFAQIEIEAEPVGEDGVALKFLFEEMPSWMPLVAVVYTEENGFSVGPGLSALNFKGRAIKIASRAFFGGTTQYWARVSWPWIARNHLSFDFFGAHYVRDDELRGFEETSDELTPEVGTWLGDHGRIKGMLSLFRMRSDVEDITLTPENDDLLRRAGVSLGWDTRDSWRNPRSGWQNELEVWRTGGFLGGDGDFWSMNLDVRRWFRTTDRQKLLLSGLASLQSGVLGQDVPLYLDYRLGGASTMRGYDVNDLGTRITGKNQLLGTAEYSFTLMPLRRWDVWRFALRLGVEFAVFADVGVAWSEPEQLNMSRTRAGVGAGLRMLVPGSDMTRFDIGWSREGGLEFHFGSWSKPTAQRFRLR